MNQDGILRNKANFSGYAGVLALFVQTGGGCLAPVRIFKLSKILGGRASREGAPAASLRRMSPERFYETKPNRRAALLRRYLLLEISLAGAAMAGLSGFCICLLFLLLTGEK